MITRSLGGFGAGVVLIASVLGCEAKPVPTPRTTPVRGKVLVNGRGVGGVVVVFHPLFDIGPVKFAPGATTNKDGTFELTSGEAGAPVGEYTVTFAWPEPSKDPEEGDLKVDRWKGRYSDPKASKFKVTVKDGDNELPPFKLD